MGTRLPSILVAAAPPSGHACQRGGRHHGGERGHQVGAGRIDCSGGACVCAPAPEAVCDVRFPVGGGQAIALERTWDTCGGAPIEQDCAGTMQCFAGEGCANTVLDETSPYYAQSCPLVQQFEHRTALDADCRCLSNQTTTGPDVCDRPTRIGAEGVRIGSGPSMMGIAGATYNGGFVDGGTLYVAVQHGGSSARKGLIMAVDIATGDRRVVSGDHPQTGVVGAGPVFEYAIDVRRGPDGNLYAWSDAVTARVSSILRIDPTTGDRTPAWQGNTAGFGQCLSGSTASANNGVSVQYTDLGFAVDGAGAFYVGYANATADGRGIVKISADGQTCSYVTADGPRQDGFTRGTGPALGGFVQGFALRDGAIYAFTTQPKQLLRIDLATGNRTAVVTAAAGGIIGERWAAFDDAHGVLWTTGFPNSVTIVGVNLARPQPLLDVFSSCGDPAFSFFPLCAAGPININTQNIAGVYVDAASGRFFLAQDNVGIVEFEVDTGNSTIVSL